MLNEPISGIGSQHKSSTVGGNVMNTATEVKRGRRFTATSSFKSGEAGIRTLGTLAGTLVFETSGLATQPSRQQGFAARRFQWLHRWLHFPRGSTPRRRRFAGHHQRMAEAFADDPPSRADHRRWRVEKTAATVRIERSGCRSRIATADG